MGMREEFEAYRDRRNALLESEGHRPGSKWHVTNAHYATWEESRAVLVIELPHSWETYCGTTEEFVMYADDVRDTLTNAGVSYK